MRGIGAFSGLRATVRLARRDAWRHKGRSTLVAIMVALPVLLLSVVAVLVRSGDFDPQDDVATQLGNRAQAVIMVSNLGTPIRQGISGDVWASPTEISSNQAGQSSGSSAPEAEQLTAGQLAERIQQVLPAGDRLVTDRRVYAGRRLKIGDRSFATDLREFDYTAAGVEGMVVQLAGRPPSAAGEVVISRSLAKHERLRIGDRLQYSAPDAPSPVLTVTGIAGGIGLIADQVVIGKPGLIPSAGLPGFAVQDQHWVVAGPAPFDWHRITALNQYGLTVQSRDVLLNPSPDALAANRRLEAEWNNSPDAGAVVIGAVVVGLILLQLALLAGPAIAVGARRSERTLALVSANGGLPRQLRAIVLASSIVAGLVGSLLAAVLGAAIGAVAVPVLRDRFEQVLPRTDIHPLDLAALVAVGTLTVTGAALIPARLASRLNVIATLTGRRGQAAPARHVPITGLLVAIAGVVCSGYAAVQHRPVLLVAGIAVAEIGLVTATGAIIALVARTGRFLPFASRFAVRDAARQRGRTAPAVAAVMAAIAGSVAASVYFASQDAHDRAVFRPELPLGTVSAGFDNDQSSGADPVRPVAVEAELRRSLPVQNLVVVQGARSQPDTYVETGLRLAPGQTCPSTNPFDRNDEEQGGFCLPDAPGQYQLAVSDPVFGDGVLAANLTGQPQPVAARALQTGRVAVFHRQFLWPDGTVHVLVVRHTDQPDDKPVVTPVTLPATYVKSVHPLASPIFPASAAKALALRITPQGVVATTTRMPSHLEEERALTGLDDLGSVYLNIQRSYQSTVGLTLLALLAAAALITLAGTFTAVGLARAEGAADVATLAAVGASPALRRRLSAAQAGVITVIGAALGLATGLLVAWALIRLTGPIGHGLWVSQAPADGSAWTFTVPWATVLGTVAGG